MQLVFAFLMAQLGVAPTSPEWFVQSEGVPQADAARDLILAGVDMPRPRDAPLGPAAVYTVPDPLDACKAIDGPVDRFCIHLSLGSRAGEYVLQVMARPRHDPYAGILATGQRFVGPMPGIASRAEGWLDTLIAEWGVERREARLRVERLRLEGDEVMITPGDGRSGFVSVDRGPQQPLPLALPADGEERELLVRLEGCAPEVLRVPLDPQVITVHCGRPTGRALRITSPAPRTRIDLRVDGGDWNYFGLAGPDTPLDRWLPSGTTTVDVRCRREGYIGWTAPATLTPIGPTRFDCLPSPRANVLTVRVDAPETRILVDGAPIAVRPLDAGGSLSPENAMVDLLDADQTYALPFLESGTYTITAEASGRRPWSGVVTAGRRPLHGLAIRLSPADEPPPAPATDEIWVGEVVLWTLRFGLELSGRRSFTGDTWLDAAQRLGVSRWVAERWQASGSAWIETELTEITRGWGVGLSAHFWPNETVRLEAGPTFRQVGHEWDTVGSVTGHVYAVECGLGWHPTNWLHLMLIGDIGVRELRREDRIGSEGGKVVLTRFDGQWGVGLRVGFDWSASAGARGGARSGQ